MDIQAYMLNYFNALQALEDEQEEQRQRAKDESLSDSDRAEAAAAFLDLTRQIAHFKDAHEAFLRTFGGPGVAPPSDAVIQRSKDLAAGLAQQLAANLTAVALLGIVTKFVNAWAGLGGGAPAGISEAVASAALEAAKQPASTPNLALLAAHAKKSAKADKAKAAGKSRR